MTAEGRIPRRRWRFYETPSGARPVAEFIDGLTDSDAARVLAAMNEVRQLGLIAARHLDGEIYEVRVDGRNQTFRVLFATEGRYNHILLALEGFSKKTRRTPPQLIQTATQRLAEWRARGRERSR